MQQKQQEKVYRSELTPVSFLRRNAYVFPDKVAIVHGERRYTYQQFEERVNRLSSRLRDAGLWVLDAGHVGLVMGRGAKKDLWPQVSNWLKPRSG